MDATGPMNAERVLFVHAHPDDESISTGGTIAMLVAAGAAVTVLTCTRGELGEVIPDELQYLLHAPGALAAYREGELAAAMRVLGVTDHRYLGEANARWQGLAPRRYLDSGMRWGAAGAEADGAPSAESLTAATLVAVTSDIAAVIAAVDPTVVISYDANGGYGHPDHVRVAESARRAAEVMDVDYFEIVPAGESGSGVVAVNVAAVAAQKRAALAAYRTQLVLSPDGGSFAFSNGQSQPIGLTESFRPVAVEPESASIPFRDQTLGVKIMAAAVLVFFGVVVGALMTAVHQANAVVDGVTLPWGLVLALVASTSFIVGVRILTSSRVVTALAGLAVVGVTLYLEQPTVGGSVIVPANFAGYLWTYAPMAVLLVSLAWPNLRRHTK